MFGLVPGADLRELALEPRQAGSVERDELSRALETFSRSPAQLPPALGLADAQ